MELARPAPTTLFLMELQPASPATPTALNAATQQDSVFSANPDSSPTT